MAKEKFEVTKNLLSPELEERILLARSVTANSLLYSAHEIHLREVSGKWGRAKSLASAIVKLIIKEHASAQRSMGAHSVSFELTLGEIKILIQDLEMIAKKLETMSSQGQEKNHC